MRLAMPVFVGGDVSIAVLGAIGLASSKAGSGEGVGAVRLFCGGAGSQSTLAQERGSFDEIIVYQS